MPRRFSIDYLDWAFAMPDFRGLVELYSTIWGWSGFCNDKSDYGLPEPLFAFFECQVWFAQGIRSGVWTYYEVVSPSRQFAMQQALRRLAPPDFSENYAIGMRDWQDEAKIETVDRWMQENEDAANQWLLDLITKNRALLEEITA